MLKNYSDLLIICYGIMANRYKMFCTFVLEFVGNNYYINILIMARKKSMLELHRVDVEQYRHVSKLPVTVVLDNVRSEMNVGSVFRTADAFLIERIMLCGITPRPPKPEIHKTALGAEESVDWQYYATTVEAIEQLKGEGYMICSIEQVHDSVSLD